MSKSQGGGRVFWSESERRKQGVQIQDGQIQDGIIQDGCHHQVESEWLSLSQIELVWVRVLCKMAESKMALSESNIVEFKMPAIIKLSQKEWVNVFFCANGANQSWQVWVSLTGKTKMTESKKAKFKMAEFKMASIIKLSQNE